MSRKKVEELELEPEVEPEVEPEQLEPEPEQFVECLKGHNMHQSEGLCKKCGLPVKLATTEE